MACLCLATRASNTLIRNGRRADAGGESKEGACRIFGLCGCVSSSPP